ncbi:hypothetical protein HBH98_054050 [Parastagonospora nodorum]|nr:hypothetical protein HBH53_249960 [Parastagonospora nodorum]KAH3957274.1 hypothetical protein HBH51_227490 [Parastagonospora nodorum]KAH3972964.1 hypothetical protein HBH52_148170 [Parastagonospora nodorum]KAH4004264.1 hypothetical protein HBI10_055110 [Parastagonospora nodorum]KAH4017132.1 hypothetical protein HBI13_147930 [Parastagonospora nodorum]
MSSPDQLVTLGNARRMAQRSCLANLPARNRPSGQDAKALGHMQPSESPGGSHMRGLVLVLVPGRRVAKRVAKRVAQATKNAILLPARMAGVWRPVSPALVVGCIPSVLP